MNATESHEAAAETEKLRRVHGTTSEHGHAVIKRAVMLDMAVNGDVGPDTLETHGEALVRICERYLSQQAERLRASKGGV